MKSQVNPSTGVRQDDVFGEVYLPFAQRSPEELNRALASLPPPKPAPILSVEKAQAHLPFKLVLAQCPSLLTLKGVQLTKEVFPDGTLGQILTHVIYRYQDKEIILNELLLSSPDKAAKPESAKEIETNNGTVWLLDNWVPGRTEIWWTKNSLTLALWVDKSIPTEVLIKMVNCVE
ncbi:MAG: hypothetical protein HZB51_14870 [Chloroflexi bacterium]|nr:hypothetical protein [Chloroflexota bacterium]